MTDVRIRTEGRAGRITLDRGRAMNALTPAMAAGIDAALDRWRDDEAVEIVVIDAVGEKAFCAGGDIAMIYEAGKAGDLESPRAFWRDEYRLNAKLYRYPKPIASFMQGFTMGGGVGIGCHVSHRVVGESSKIAMPECGIGLVPDVGGSLILARAPGALGEYLGTTGHRMGPSCALLAGFADDFVPEERWSDLIGELERHGDPEAIAQAAENAGESPLFAIRDEVDRHFAMSDLPATVRSLRDAGSDFASDCLTALGRAAPLSACCTVELVREARGHDTIEDALRAEYRFTHRAVAGYDLMEGIRAAVIDKDRTPAWRHESIETVSREDIEAMLAPLGASELELGEPS